MMDYLQRVESETAVERRRAEGLREQLAASEARLAKLEITRETLLGFQVEGSGEQVDGQEEDRSTVDPPKVRPSNEEAPADAETATPRRALSDLSRNTVVLLASADRPLKSREVAEALGDGGPATHNQVEVTRTRLKRLVTAGLAAEPEQGRFVIAAGVNGYAMAGGADTHS